MEGTRHFYATLWASGRWKDKCGYEKAVEWRNEGDEGRLLTSACLPNQLLFDHAATVRRWSQECHLELVLKLSDGGYRVQNRVCTGGVPQTQDFVTVV